jgi:hypothetical protein
MRSGLHPALLATAALAAGCRAPAGPRDEPQPSRACAQTYEFGNTGCADLVGVVVGLRDQPLPGILVTLRPGAQGNGLGAGSATTDTAGAFRLRAIRYGGQPPASGPDTASLWVAGADPRTSGLGVSARVRDSVLVQVSVSPVGAVPAPAAVRLMLPAP